MKAKKNTSERACFHHSSNLVTNALCYRRFPRNLPKIYRTVILKNFFQYMNSKSQKRAHPVVFFNPLMLVVKKDTHT